MIAEFGFNGGGYGSPTKDTQKCDLAFDPLTYGAEFSTIEAATAYVIFDEA